MCLSVHRFICVEKKNQLDATELFIALIICSTCFAHFYAHHQELETICYYRLWCVVLGCCLSGVMCRTADYASTKTDVARLRRATSLFLDSLLPCSWPPTTSNQALHTIGGSNTHTYSLELLIMVIEVPEHVEHIISAINHSVVSSLFSSLRICNDARTNTHQANSLVNSFM